VDALTGRLATQSDVWDAVEDNKFLSVRAQLLKRAFTSWFWHM